MFVATINVPGYLPMDDEPPTFETAREGWQYLVSEVERSWDDNPGDYNGACVSAHADMHNIDQSRPGTVFAGTPGYDGNHDLGLAYSVTEVESIRHDVIYRVVSSPTEHSYIIVRDEDGDDVPHYYGSQKRALLALPDAEIVHISKAAFDILGEF